LQDNALSEVSTSWVPGQYIIKYNNKSIEELREDPNLASFSPEVIENALTEILAANTVENLPLIEATTIVAQNKNELDIDSAVDLINADLVEYISPDFIRNISAVPNDPRYSELWGMSQNNDIDINGPQAADKASFSETSDIIVGVVDTGIDYNHPDLKDNMWKNPQELNGIAGVDDDRNGYIDDVYGYNAITNSGNPFDDNKHGTHCAGTIGARGNNGIGVAGVVWNVKLMALKFLDAKGSGSDSGAIKAINYAVTMRNRGGNLKVLSNSWGGGGYNAALEEAIRKASDAGILFVAAAGNENTNTDISANYPSCYDVPNVLAVAAIDKNGNRASFSNYGARTVDLAAPGVGILSTVPGNLYESLNGTSMATPHISGIAVLLFGQSTQITPVDVKNSLMQSVKPLTPLNGFMIKAGIPDAAKIASDVTNRAPEIQPIANQYIDPLIRKILVPVVAFDRDKQVLSIKAEEEKSPESQATQMDREYGFVLYQATSVDYYWKLIIGKDNRRFYIRYDGLFLEQIGSGYVNLGNIGVEFYGNPYLLIDAYNPDRDSVLDVRVIAGSPSIIEILVKKDFTKVVNVIVVASDGDKTDTTQFSVEMRTKGACQ